MFSSLLDRFNLPQNRLYQERDRRLSCGLPVIDLISGNVHHQGIQFPENVLQKALTHGLKQSRIYQPSPRGQKKAREAISRYYARDGVSIPPEQIWLTPGTSLSYLYAFKLLGESGDEFLCPRPSYPLFDSIAALADVRLTSYPLHIVKARWAIDWAGLIKVITPRTKAIVLISPHNPTGAVASRDEVQRLCQLAAERNLALISDEVFSPFLFTQDRLSRPASFKAPLVLTLNGFSKMLALPGFKIGWMAVTGNPSLVEKAQAALDMISDTFLPVHEATQAAIPILLKEGLSFAVRFQSEIQKRMDLARRELARYPIFEWVRPEGGFYFSVKLRKTIDDDTFAYEALRQHGLMIHPGFFYDLGDSSFVLSGVVKPTVFKKAVRQLADLAKKL